MRTPRPLLILLVVLQLLAMPASLLARGWENTASQSIQANAGGWGFATPLMIAGVGIYQHLKGTDDFEASDLLNRKVLGGLAGDFATVAIFNALAPALPFGPLLRNYFVMFGGFLGWELGSGNIQDADWLSMATQAAAATLIQSGLQAVALAGGLALGPLPIAVLSIAGAITVDILLDRLREDPEASSDDRPGAPTDATLTGAPPTLHARAPAAPGGSTAPRVRAEEYRALLRSLEGADAAVQRTAWERYQSASP